MDLNSKFSNKVAAKYQIYNSLFLTLPFEEITNTGVLLPVLFKECQDGFNAKKNPTEIIDTFFEKHADVETEEEKIQLLFKFMQYIERQVVLFDAVEDAAFEEINDLNGNGTVRYVFNRASSQQKMDKLIKKLEDFKVRIVLTAHPTQFYPGRVLSIIGELENAIRESNLQKINELLQQLGRTAFVSKEKPTPYDEAIRLMWYLENVFYHSVGNVHSRVRRELAKQGVTDYDKDIINIGFWPCGDRDGNPFVTSDITLETARQLRHKIFICYFRDAKKLRKRMTFTGVDQLAEKVYNKLSSTIFNTKGKRYKAAQEIISDLEDIKNYIVKNHQGLFVDVVEDFIVKVKLFGFHFTYMDIRQDSRIHSEVIDEIFQAAADGKLGDTVKGKIPANYADLSDEEQINVLTQLEGNIDPELFETEIVRETLKSFYVMKQIQEENGETGCHRYIISNTQSSKNMFEVYALARICGWKIDEMTFDIVPLLETVEDLDNGEDILGYMYSHPVYQKHLAARNKRQYVMLGFSDGTKDGGYLKANWSIFTAKENLSGISKDNKVKIIFFDGRGGPPARGGGNTNKFYSSLGDRIEDHEIQLTIQGQTISSNYGTLNSSQYNLEQFFCAGLENTVFKGDVASMNDSQRDIMNNLADLGFEAYNNFKNDPLFVDYLEDVSVLQYYGKTNIGSRPSKRKSNGKLNLADLRAIPFVGAWTQMKQNVPGFYGVGAALKKYEDEGRIDEIKDFYAKSLFFRTLIDNSIQSVVKSYFPLTSYLEEDKKFGQFWKGIFNEYEQTKRLLLYISDQKELMERSPNNKASIELRENIILPLITMQQYALMKVKAIEKGDKNSEKWKAAYEMMIIRAFFGSINASRNAA
ncbi:MAG: phosphoenolpyruvate carboxylase [Flavobacteriales bacterium]|jgi:phosphoenolpyruvate carboxylase|tara:strand:- start:17320 stop:19923 length:2604 start_codon:yes stop_codon:yes gene_type:complete